MLFVLLNQLKFHLVLIYRRLVLFGAMGGQVRWNGPCTEYVPFNHVPRPQVPGPERCCACWRWRSYCRRLEAQYMYAVIFGNGIPSISSILVSCWHVSLSSVFHAIDWNNCTQHRLFLMTRLRTCRGYLIIMYIFIQEWHCSCVYIWWFDCIYEKMRI